MVTTLHRKLSGPVLTLGDLGGRHGDVDGQRLGQLERVWRGAARHRHRPRLLHPGVVRVRLLVLLRRRQRSAEVTQSADVLGG